MLGWVSAYGFWPESSARLDSCWKTKTSMLGGKEARTTHQAATAKSPTRSGPWYRPSTGREASAAPLTTPAAATTAKNSRNPGMGRM